jgi:hypothetical protein
MKKLILFLILFLASLCFATDPNLVAHYLLNEVNDSNIIFDQKATVTGFTAASHKFVSNIPSDANAWITFTNRTVGTVGNQGGANSVTVELKRFASNPHTTPIVAVTNRAIVVNRGTFSGNKTALQIKDAIEANSAASALVTCTIYNGGGDKPVATAATYLSGGTDTISSQGVLITNTNYLAYAVDVNEQARFVMQDYSDSNGCHFWQSNDGKAWTHIGVPYIPPHYFCEAPTLAYSNTLGKYLIAYGTHNEANSTSWIYGTTVGLATIERDLSKGTWIQDIDLGSRPCWAPELSDSSGQLRMFLMTGWMLYETHPVVANAYGGSWTEKKSLGIFGYDPYPIQRPNDPNFYMFYVSGDYIEVAVSATINDVYIKTTDVNDWAGWRDNAVPAIGSAGIEGPCVMWLGGTNWRAYFQKTLGPSYWSESADNWATWTNPVLCTDDSPKYRLGHGSILDRTNKTYYKSTTGKINGALSFNGTTDYVDTGQTFQSTFQNNFTISFWMKPTNGRTNNEQVLFNEGVDSIIECRITYDGHILAYYGTAGENFETYFTMRLPFGPSDWTLLTITATKVGTTTKIQLYKNGILEETSTIGFNMSNFTSTTPMRLATGWNEITSQPVTMYAGGLDDVRIYNKALTKKQINALYYGAGSPGCTNSIKSDLDNDCQVDLLDFTRLANAWAGNPPQVDLNGDEVLDFKDIAQFALDWLTCNRNPAEECWQ